MTITIMGFKVTSSPPLKPLFFRGLTEYTPNGLLDKSIGVKINCCSCLVQNQNLGLSQKCPGGKIR